MQTIGNILSEPARGRSFDRTMRCAMVVLLLACVMPVSARMYQWTDPKTGITQLAGMPPPWYRSARGGPRVFVFENGRLIDDTGRKVPAPEREQLRTQAFLQESGGKNKTGKLIRGAPQLQAGSGASPNPGEQPTGEKPPQQKSPEPKPPVQPKAPAPRAATNLPAPPSVEQMRKLIQRWEAAQEQNARRQADIQSPPPAGP